MPRENTDYVLDHDRNITVNPTTFPFPNMHALDYLPYGIGQLATTVRQEEIAFNQDQPIPGSDIHAFGRMGTYYASYFNWFCSSLTNYLRLVGFVELVNQHQWSNRDVTANMGRVKSHCSQYVKEVVPDIVRWRNKIAAHSALTAPQKGDNPALLEYSVIDFVSYRHPYLTAGDIQLSSIDGSSSEMTSWALTEEFERLKPRFWRDYDIEIPPFPTSSP